MMSSFLLIARLTASSSFTRYKSTHIPLGSLLQHKHTASLFFFNSFTSATSSDSESDGNHLKGDTFTVSYLINSCGVSPTLARELSNKFSLKNPDGSNAVLDLLNNYGFSKTQLAKLLVRHPLVLLAKAENTLLPKLKFFRSIGVSNTDMPKILIANPSILKRSLEKCLIPRYEFLKSVIYDDREVVRVLKGSPLGFEYFDFVNALVPNIKILRQSGVSQASISFLLTIALPAAYVEHSRFVEAVKTVKEIGFSPLKTKAIAEYPQVVAYSLEKRIIPRFSVIKILKSKGLLEKNMHFSSIVCITEEKFLEKFVVNFQKILPFLPDVYRGLINPSNVL